MLRTIILFLFLFLGMTNVVADEPFFDEFRNYLDSVGDLVQNTDFSEFIPNSYYDQLVIRIIFLIPISHHY